MFCLTQAEGLITGTMVKMFTIAGPVIVSGTVASAVKGLVPVLLGHGDKSNGGGSAEPPPCLKTRIITPCR